MKKLFILIFLIPTICFSRDPPKGTNTIIVKNVTVESVVKHLEAMEFNVANDGFGTITTFPKILGNHGKMQIMVSVKDSVAYITGVFENKEITPELFKNKESYAGHDLSGTFNIMKAFAESLKGEISYTKQ
jgi:hypothetical protein